MDLVIDGNALLNVVTNVVVYSIRNNSNFDLSYIVADDRMILKDSSKMYFKKFVIKYLTSIITPLRYVLQNVYFVFDTTSWRKFYIQKYFERHPELPGFAYKGHRKTDDHKRELFMFFDYFKDEVLPELLALSGIHEIRVKGCEGDDIVAILSEILQTDKVLWTVDSDISQLVKPGKNFTIVFGPKNKGGFRKLVLPVGYDDKNTGLMDFNIENFSLEKLAKYMVREKQYEALVIEPNDFTLRKIIMGDLKSDNIPSIYVRISKTGLRMSITDRKVETILSVIEKEFDRMRWLELIDAKDANLIARVSEVTRNAVGASKDELQGIVDNFELNSRLIRLSSQMIPSEMTGMINYKYSQLDLSSPFDYQHYLDYSYLQEQEQ